MSYLCLPLAHLIKSRVLENFTALKTILFGYEESHDLLTLPVCPSSSLLRTLSTLPHLRHIVLAAGLNATRWYRLDEVCEILGWQLLDELLSGDAFPSLTMVKLTVYLVGPADYYALLGFSPSPEDVAMGHAYLERYQKVY
uniref:Uncharacterized protein n=1 Tax=Moniliophthora roreri TaxID=221103 RepID=A0A0W0G521_MONRR